MAIYAEYLAIKAQFSNAIPFKLTAYSHNTFLKVNYDCITRNSGHGWH